VAHYALSLLWPTQALSPMTGHVCLVDSAHPRSPRLIVTEGSLFFLPSTFGLSSGSILKFSLPVVLSSFQLLHPLSNGNLQLTSYDTTRSDKTPCTSLQADIVCFVLVRPSTYEMLSEYAEYPGGRSTWYSKYQSSMYSMSDELEPEETLYTPRIGPAINDGNNSSAPKSSNAVTSTKPSIKKTRFVYEPSLPARLNGREISAFPDIGAPANFIALRYVRDRGLSINFAARKLVKTPVGTTIIIIGTVILQFSFEDECKCHTKSHRLEFNVINKPVRDVIVGSPFLDLTQTFTRNVHRIRQNLRKIRLPRICFLGSRQHVMGHVNGIHVDAMPDTGADVPVMSLSFAERHGFIVNTSPRHQTLLEFLNGSTANSIGVVDVEWQFESSKTLHRIHAFVLKELQTDLILDNTFLHDTNAFISHEEDFSTCICWRRRFENYWMISIIKLVGSVLKYSKWRNSCKSLELIRSVRAT
jgi:hypothetical protein